jgi:3-hydroxybutyryl-CoA dehydrogenase
MNNSIGVIGTGVMGRSIARLCAQKGYPVLLVAHTKASAMQAEFNLQKEIRRKVEKGHLHPEVGRRIIITDSPCNLRETKFIIEAITEGYAQKQSLYFSLEPLIDKRAVIASNTSSLCISKLAEGMMHPERLIGVHFFNPAEVMKLVEIKMGAHTDTNTMEKVVYHLNRLEKESIIFPDRSGICVNRLLFPMLVEAMWILEETKMRPEDIDKAMKLGTNMPLGPFELCDLIGNDVVLNICEQLLKETGDSKYLAPILLKNKVLEMELGRKTEIGFYDYRGK